MAYTTLNSLLTAIANAIRSKKDTTAKINAQNFPSEILSILKGSGNAQPSDVLSGKTFTNDSDEQTGTMPNRGAWGTTISPGGSVTIPSGYHNGGGTVSAHNATASLGEVTKGVVNGRSDKNINATVGHYIATSVVRVNSGATRILWGDGVWGVNIYQITSTTVSLHNGDGNSGGYVIFKINIG